MKAVTRSMTRAGLVELTQPLPMQTRRNVRLMDEDGCTQSEPQDDTQPRRRQEETIENIAAVERNGEDPIFLSASRRGPGSVASSGRTRSSVRSRRRLLEKEEELARLREIKRQTELRKARVNAELANAEADAEVARCEDQMHLVEQRSQLASDDEDVYEEVRSNIASNKVNDWMSEAGMHLNTSVNHVEEHQVVNSQTSMCPPNGIEHVNGENGEIKDDERTIVNEGNRSRQRTSGGQESISVDSSKQFFKEFTDSFSNTMEKVMKSMQPSQVHNDMNGFLARQCGGTKDLPDFHGDPEDWIAFIQRYDTSTNLCRFSNDENLMRLQRCLKGKAREAVSAMLSTGCHAGEILRVLEKRFGRPELVFKRMMEKLRYTPSPAEGDLQGIVELSTVVKNLCATAKSLNLQAYLTSPHLLEELKRKLPSTLQLDWGRYMIRLHRIADIEDFSNYLDEVSDAAALVCDALPTRRKSREHGHFMVLGETGNCILACKDKHSLSSCPKFKRMKIDERWDFVKKNRTCFSCLDQNHRTFVCSKRKICGVDNCVKQHHRMLHSTEPKSNTSQPPKEAKSSHPPPELSVPKPNSLPKPQTSGVTNVLGVVSQVRKPIGNVLMKILPVELCGPKGKMVVNAFLDDGSSLTILEEEVANSLGLSGSTKPLHLSWQGGRSDYDEYSKSVSLTIRGVDEDEEYVMTDVRTKRNLNLPVQPLSSYKLHRRWKHLENVPFPEVLSSRPVIVIGEDNIHLMVGRKFAEGPSSTPMASWTYLGWVIHGPCGKVSGLKTSQVAMISLENSDPDQALHELVKEQFRLESLGIVNCPNLPMSASNRRAEEIMTKNSSKDGNKWTAPMLWKSDELELPNNWPMARRRLELLEREMDKSPPFAELYCRKIEEYVEKGFCHKLSYEDLLKEEKRLWYLPHFGTTNPNKPGKLRLVFDCAAKYQGTSLNDALIQGRDLMSPLMNVLMKFREREIAFSGDIRDMFHMVSIQQEDLAALRFLWRGKDRSRRPDVFQMDVMVFGAVSSPYQAQWIKNRNAEDFRDQFPEAVDAIQNRHYVDDYLDSCSTREKAIKKIMEVREIHKQGGFEIRGWNCNDVEVLKVVAPGEQPSIESISLSDNKMERVLGLHWVPQDDIFTFKSSFSKVDPQLINGEKVPTKRQLLQLVMSIFDPLGFVGHLTARGRMLLQCIWKSGIGWDEEIGVAAAEKWRHFISQVRAISEVSIRRCFAPQICHGTNFQIHTFCDASQQAFGSVTYLRVVGAHGEVTVNIVMSKTKVTPIQFVSIPRLELEAALIGARQTRFTKSMLDFNIHATTLWTDSRNVIYWLRAEDPSRFKIYVAHRIGEILDLTDVSNWRWVPTADNVADDCTRDAVPADLSISSRWFVGPSFLMKAEEEWPVETWSNKEGLCTEQLEEKAVCMSMYVEYGMPNVVNFSCLMRLMRVTAWMIRYTKNVSVKAEDRTLSKHLHVQEIQAALQFWIKKAQSDSFLEEVSCLTDGKPIGKGSKLFNLSPILRNGVICIDSRLINATKIPTEMKYPAILERKHPLTRLLVMWYHKMHGHVGYEKICNELRQSYWILGMKNAVKAAAKECVECQMRMAKQVYPKMAALPEVRTTRPSRPFTYVGVDYFGPLDVVHGRKHEKRYGVLFTCLSIRAVHLEVAHSLSTDDFLMALERFICTRGEPLELWSDNGTNFKGAEKELKKALKELDQQKITDKLGIRGISWKFIPPSAPHMGGAWERLVQSVKTALKIILKNRVLTDAVLSTVLAEAMASVNNRPITAVSEDWNDDDAITPNSFLIGTTSIKQPQGVFTDQDMCTRKRWRMARVLSNHFWNRWTKEYLTSLTLRTKWRKETPAVKVGEIVFVPDTNELTQQWQKGLVTNVYPGKDGQTRVVEVRTAKGLIKRPSVKLLRIQPIQPEGDIKDLSHGEGYVPAEQNCNVMVHEAEYDSSMQGGSMHDGSMHGGSTDASSISPHGGSTYAGSTDASSISPHGGSTYAGSTQLGSSQYRMDNASVTKDSS